MIITWATFFADGPPKTLRHQHETEWSLQSFTHDTASLSQTQNYVGQLQHQLRLVETHSQLGFTKLDI
jgi:hypothetical protein